MRVLVCISAYNRPAYVRNAVESVRRFFPFGDLVVVDDGSDIPAQQAYLDELDAQGTAVIRRVRTPSRVLRGGLYAGMNDAIELGLARDYDVILFLQDDMQFMWHDRNVLARVAEIFAERPDACQISPMFFKRIVLDEPDRLEPLERPRCYRIPGYGMSDTGFVPLSLVDREGFRFSEGVDQSEATTSAFWASRGYRLYALGDPLVAWLPYPVTPSGGEYGLWGQPPEPLPPAQEFYLKPLDEDQVRTLTRRPVETIAIHEDYVVPWGWSCPSPYWFSSYSDEYLKWIVSLLRSRRPVLPRRVSSGKPAYSVPPRGWLFRRVTETANRKLAATLRVRDRQRTGSM